MSDVLNLRKEITAFRKSERFDAYSKIIINVTDDLCYEAGDNTGRTLTLSCPWGTQAMANNLLSHMRGFSYQPYTAEGAILNPASELGDGINVNGVYSGMYRIDTRFNSHCSADISAPFDEEINYEFPYKSKQEREVKRQNSKFSSQLTLQANQIKAEVEERKEQGETLQTAITVESGRITQEVAERKAQNTTLLSRITQEAGRITQEITDRTKQGNTLSSAITQEANRITQEIKNRSDAIDTVNSVLSQQAGQISAKVSKTGGNSSSFGWTLDESSWTLQSNGSNVLKATKNGLEIKGKITATSGTIGGFTINSNNISYNGQTWNGTNSTGIYFGPNGIQLGKHFRVDAKGNLTANNGTFRGTVDAGNIRYGYDSDGNDHGTLSGYALGENTISGSRLEYNTVTTDYTSDGINSSLRYADFANGVFNDWNTAPTIRCNGIRVQEKYFAPVTLYYTNAGGDTSVVTVLGHREE